MSLKNRNILITGVSGFVGSRMARYLVDEGAKVFGLMRRRGDGEIPINIKYMGIEREINLLQGDVQDISSIGCALDESQPDVIFHFAAQTFVPRSISHPMETAQTNCSGTANLLEAVRIKELDPVIVYPGSSEEYGLVITSQLHYERALEKYGVVYPEPQQIPELPIDELNSLRPLSPYSVSKVYCDFLMRNYHACYGMKTVVSRAFNHEGAGRGIMFVTSNITNQVMKLKLGETDRIAIGNVNAFRDWSHINDLINGYCVLAEHGRYGDVYVQGSQRTNSVLSYILLSLERAGYEIDKIETMRGKKSIETPTEMDDSEMFGLRFEKTKVDKMMLEEKLEFQLSDGGIVAYTNRGKVPIEFDEERFRPVEVEVLLSSSKKIQKIGFKIRHSLKDIIDDQLNYFLEPKRL